MKKIRVGFTLLELLLVIVIIAVFVAAVSALVRKNIEYTRFTSFVNETYFLLDYAQKRAMFKSMVITVEIVPQKKRMVLIDDKKNLQRIVRRAVIPANIRVESNCRQICFFPDGTSQEFSLVIAATNGWQQILESKGIDGKIVIEDENE